MGKRRRTKGILARVVALALAFAPRLASASPEDLFGYGARTSAMAATGTAHARGYEAAWANPALASLSRHTTLVLGVLAANPRLEARGAGLPGRASVDAARSVLVGLELPVPLGGPLARRVGLSFGFSTPTDVIVRGRVLYPEKTQFPVLGDRAQSLALRAGLGVAIGDEVRAGVGVGALAELRGIVVAATDASGRVGTSVETQLVATYAPTFGLSWERALADARVRIGAVYRGELDARFAVVVDGTKLSSLPIPLFDIAGAAQYDPAQVALEVAREEEGGVLALQGVWKRWSAFPGIVAPTVVCAEGGSCGLAPPVIAWRDTFAIRAGAERFVRLAPAARFAVRAGVAFESSPLPDSLPTSEAYDRRSSGVVQVPTAYFDANRVVSTIGLGVELTGPSFPVRLDVFAQGHALLPRTIRSVDPAGAVRLEGEVSGTVGVFGAALGVRF